MFIPVRSSYRDLIPCIIKCALCRLNRLLNSLSTKFFHHYI